LLYIGGMSGILTRCRVAFLCLLGISLFPLGCGGRSMNKGLARDILAGSPAGTLEDKDIEVVSVTQLGAGQAVVATNLRAAFRLRRSGGKWEVREVKIGNGEWESLDDILAALLRIKIEDTRRRLERIAAAIEAYRQKNGHLPVFKDYVQLSDALYPDFLSPLIRLDVWNHPLEASAVGANSIRIASAGPDGVPGTADDIELTRVFPS